MRRRGFVSVLVVVAVIAVLASGCSRLAASPGAGPAVGILSRGLISSPQLSFQSVDTTDYTTLVPSASAVAKGLGSDTWAAVLTGDWQLVYECVNNGSNTPLGEFYTSRTSALSFSAFQSTTKNGTTTVDLANSDPTTGRQYFQNVLDTLVGSSVSDYCPNDNYSAYALGARWYTFQITLYDLTTLYDEYPGLTIGSYSDLLPYIEDGTITASDQLDFTCSDPANPSSDTCTVDSSKKNG